MREDRGLNLVLSLTVLELLVTLCLKTFLYCLSLEKSDVYDCLRLTGATGESILFGHVLK